MRSRLGPMCCSVSGKGGLLIRVLDYDKAVAAPHAKPMKMGRRTMRGFVRVTPRGYRTEDGLERWIQLGIEAALASSRARKRLQAAMRRAKAERPRRRRLPA